MKDAQSRLKRSGINLEIADIQAVLWYYEKELFAKRRGVKPQSKIDYGTAATLVRDARRNGIDLDTSKLESDSDDDDPEDSTVYPEPSEEKTLGLAV